MNFYLMRIVCSIRLVGGRIYQCSVQVRSSPERIDGCVVCSGVCRSLGIDQCICDGLYKVYCLSDEVVSACDAAAASIRKVCVVCFFL